MSDTTELCVRIVDPEEHLWRVVPHGWVIKGRVTNQAFKLRPDDNGLLSISRQSAINAEQAFIERVEQIRQRTTDAGKPFKPPVGVIAVTVADVEAVETGDGATPLTAWDDSKKEAVPDHHGYIDYTPILADQQKVQSARDVLTARARSRGWLHSSADAPTEP